jgi:HK97 gp10 family phage protein
MTEYVQLSGLTDAKQALDDFVIKMRKKIVRSALKAAAKPIITAAKANAPVKTGLVKRRIGAFSSKKYTGRDGIIGIYIKPKSSAKARKTKNSALDPFYYRFQEMGYHAVGRKRIAGGKRRRAAELATGKYRYIPGKAFLGNAIESQSKNAIDIFTESIKSAIDAENKRV